MAPSRLEGAVALVTGGSSGIGREVVRALAWRGARVIAVSRASGHGEEVARLIRHETGNIDVAFWPADLSSLEDVRRLGARLRAEHDRLNLLFNHAGAYFQTRQLTPDGFEATFALNHLAPFLLTLEAQPLLVAAGTPDAPARVVTTSSGAARWASLDVEDPGLEQGYLGVRAYARSKLANQLFAIELAERWRGLPVVSHAVHPGLVRTGIGPQRGVEAWVWRVALRFGRTAVEGAETPLHVLCHPDAATSSGRYWEDGSSRPPAPGARDAELRARLWERSLAWTGGPTPRATPA